MSKLNLFLIILTVLLGLFSISSAAPANSGYEIGAQLGMTAVFSGNDNSGIGPNGYFFLQTPLFSRFRANFGIGRGQVTDDDFRTCVTPMGAQLLFYPTANDKWNTYLYAGGGYLAYTITDLTTGFDIGVDTESGTGFFTTGLGITHKFSDSWSLDISGGYVRTFTDELEGLADGDNDSYMHVLAGLKYKLRIDNIDLDDDGLTNYQEGKLGTNPRNPDTDGDGLNDANEVDVHNTDPTKADTDSDGLSDYDEIVTHKTNPTDIDTDDDGLNDGSEITNYQTDPFTADTDEDGLSDGDEILKHNTNALVIDTDKDGLEDGDEVNEHKSDPTVPDSDGDGLTDYDEVITHKTSPTNEDTDNDKLQDKIEIDIHRTNPLRADTDNDGLTDGDEINEYKTNPLAFDTDEGSVSDFAEVKRGTDPLDPDDDVEEEVVKEDIPIGARLVDKGIYFETASAEIDRDSQKTMQIILEKLESMPDIEVEIQGHTDNVGSLESNMTLSQNRAKSVHDWLLRKGIDADRLTIKGYGPEEPAASNETEQGRRLNRRAEVVRVK